VQTMEEQTTEKPNVRIFRPAGVTREERVAELADWILGLSPGMPREQAVQLAERTTPSEGGRRQCPLHKREVQIRACFWCDFGHMAMCHWPRFCSLGECGHPSPREAIL